LGNNKPSSLKFAILTGTGAFIAAVFFSFFSEIVLPKLQLIMLSFLSLLIVIFVGIIFDMIGIAVAVADEKWFHAKASKKLRGASQSILMIRHAAKVATICNDVVGDICGTVSGVFGVTIVFQLASGRPSWDESILTMIMTGMVASLTVGGKALAKSKAMVDSQKIVGTVGRILAWFETSTGLNLFALNRRRDRRR